MSAHLNRVKLDPVIESEKFHVVGETVKFEKGLVQIALAFNFFEPVYCAMRLSQYLLQAIPIGGSPLLQLPGVNNELAHSLEVRDKPVKTVQDLLRLDGDTQRKLLESLDDKTFSQAINVAKSIPVLIVSNLHFKGIFSELG